MFLAQATVHTTGINWESVGAILGGFAAFAGLILGVIRQISKNVRTEIKESVDHLAEVLGERLATKDTVAELKKEVAVLQVQINRRGFK